MTKPIIDVNYGLASSYPEFIEINYKLEGKLREKIIKHELRHSDSNYDQKDFKNDFQSKDSYFFESLIFAIKNPESLISFFPIMYSYYAECFTYNLSSIFPFIYFGLIFSIFFLIIFKINLINSFICYSIFVILMNIFLLIITHQIVKKMAWKYS